MKALKNPLALIVLVLSSCLCAQLYALSGEPPYDGLSKEERALVLSDPNAVIVYWALEAENSFGHQEIPEEFSNMSAAQIRDAKKALVLEYQFEQEWKSNPWERYVRQAFDSLVPEEIENFEGVVMAYIRSDLKYNPANSSLYDTKFYNGNLSLIRSYSDYIFSLMEEQYSLSDLSGESLLYVGGISEMMSVLGRLNNPDPSVRKLSIEIADKLIAKFDGDDAEKVRETMYGYLGLDTTVESPTTEIPPVAPEVVEAVAEDVAAAIEESVQIAPATETAEEPIEQLSNQWLWLIGVMVIVGGVLVVRRKS